MISQAGKAFVTRVQSIWRPLFSGRYLLVTNTLTSGGMLALGDSLQQSYEINKNPDLVRDWKRTGSMFLVGLPMGPFMHYWYGFIDKMFPGNALRMIGKKILCDQALAAPALGLWFFLGMNLAEGHTLSEGGQEIKAKFWEYYKMDWCVWPPAQLINFYFLPLKYRVLYINTITLGWDTYISYLKHRDFKEPPPLLPDDDAAEQVPQELSNP